MISVTDESFLNKYNIPLGSSNLVKPDQMPIFSDMASHPENVQYVAGGSSMNTARIVRWILRCSGSISRDDNSHNNNNNHHGRSGNNITSNSPIGGSGPALQSTKTVMIGAVGGDEFKNILVHSLESESVDHIFFEKKEQCSGTCAVLVVDGERSLLANLGAATKLTGADVFGNEAGDAGEAWNKSQNAVFKALKGTRAVYMEGFFMNLAERTTSIHVANKCTELSKTFAFNLSAPYLSAIFADSLQQILPHVDILFGSRIDAVAYGKSLGWACASEQSDEDLGEIVAMLASDAAVPRSERKPDSHRRVVVVTDGANATIVGVSPTMGECRQYAAGGMKGPAPAPCVSNYIPDLIEPDQIVDSNGAGDSFAGGFLAGYLLGFPMDRAVALGHASASVVLKHSGCTFPPVPPFEVHHVGQALPFAGSLQRRSSVFGKSFVLRRKSETATSTGTHRDDDAGRKSQTEEFFEDKE